MLPSIEKIKGIHPVLILKRALERMHIKSAQLASTLEIHRQTLSAIINQRRGITPKLSIKLANYFHIDDDYFMILQACYEVKKIKATQPQNHPNLNKLRKILFWDTTFDKIDWNKNKKAIIQRVLERGNDLEIKEIINFYGKHTVTKIANSTQRNHANPQS